MPKNLIRNLSLIVGLVLLASLFVGLRLQTKSTTPLAGSTLEPAESLADFSLETATGESFTKKDLLGKWTVLSFGFTHCPTICPTTLAYFRDEINSLSETERAKTQFVFVSVDPERDTAERLQSYVEKFHPSITAVRGQIPELQNVAKIFHAYFKKEDPTPDGLYNLAHSPQYYLINPEGSWQVLYTPPLSKGAIAIDLKNLTTAF